MANIRPASFGKSRIVAPAVNLLARNSMPDEMGLNYSPPLGSTSAWIPSGGPFGGAFDRLTIGSASTAANTDWLNYGSVAWMVGTGVSIPGTIPVRPGDTHVLSAYVRMSRANPMFAQAQYLAGAGGASGTTIGATVTPSVNVWTRLSAQGIAGADAQGLRFDIDVGGPINWQVGDTFDVACFMVSAGPTLLPWTAGFRAAM